MRLKWIWIVPWLLLPPAATAGKVEIVAAKATAQGNGSYRVDVTLRHADSGWDHYADRWELLLPDGRLLATRTLYHPHVDEQPFTRSLGGVKPPQGVDHLMVRAHDKVHGDSPDLYRLALEK